MKKKSWIRIIAFLTLFGIIIWIIWTWILIIFSQGTNTNNDENITSKDLQEIINNSKSNNN